MDGDHTNYAMGKDLSIFKTTDEEYHKEWCIRSHQEGVQFTIQQIII